MEVIKSVFAKGFDSCKKILEYARVNDEKGRISLTNLALIIMLVKICQTDAASIQDLTALTIAILGYQAKRLIQK